MFPRVQDVPALTTEQMIEIDRAMVEDLRIDLVQMMENAGRNLAHLARVRFLDTDPVGKRVLILAGSGGNGGGAMACARRLHTWGAQVRVFLATDTLAPATAHQRDILARMRVPVALAAEIGDVPEPSVTVDGLIGYRLSGAPEGAAANLIRWANAHKAPVLALDVPSGVDATTGAVAAPAIRATATMTVALPKTGLRRKPGVEWVGELYLADIGVPPSLYATSLDVSVGPLFARDDIVRPW